MPGTLPSRSRTPRRALVLFRFVLCAPFPQSSQRTQATAAAGEQEITDRRRTRRDEAIPALEIDGEVVSVEPPFKVPCTCVQYPNARI